VPGTGLGLYIARELTERHGGKLELEWTEPGRGSHFALYLPRAGGQ
jgi:signal transduction histidine kinase